MKLFYPDPESTKRLDAKFAECRRLHWRMITDCPEPQYSPVYHSTVQIMGFAPNNFDGYRFQECQLQNAPNPWNKYREINGIATLHQQGPQYPFERQYLGLSGTGTIGPQTP